MRLVFSREPESVPFDLDEHVTDWRPTHDYSQPGVGARHVGHVFDGSAGYIGDDLGRNLVGHAAISALAIVTPDWSAPGIACLVARGDAGASPARYHGYEFGVDVRADELALYHAYQDGIGQHHYQDIATTGRPPSGVPLVLAWCRERDQLRAFVNGVLAGEVALAGIGPVMAVDGPVTVACRATATATYDRHYRGTLEYLELRPEAITPTQARHQHRRLWAAPPRWADIVESLLLPLPGPNYRAIRRATLGTVMGHAAADIEAAEESLSPMLAYGFALQRHEHAAGITPPATATVAERQAAVTAAIRAPGGFSVPALQSYAADLLGVDLANVSIVEGNNELTLPCVGDGRIPGPWRITGTGHAHSDADGLHLQARAGDDLRFAGINRHGIQLAVAIPHGPQVTHCAFAATLDNLVNTSASLWAGLVLRTLSSALWLAVFDSPTGRHLAWRRATPGQLTPWTEVASLVGAAELAVEYRDGQWWAQTGATGTSAHALGDNPVQWIGVALGAEGALADDLGCRLTSAHLLCGDAPGHWQWTAVCPSPRYWRDDHVALLNRRSRATASATISRARTMRCNDPAAQLGRTPLAMETAAQWLPETAADLYRALGWRPTYLFTYQGTTLREHIRGLDIQASNESLMTATTGPDGRPAVTYDPLAFHYTTDSGVLAFQGTGFAISMICRLDSTSGRLLSEWHATLRQGFQLQSTPAGVQLTIGTPSAQATCTVPLPAATWTVITLAIERIPTGWRAHLASPTAKASAEALGADFVPAARLSINRWSSSLGTAQSVRWLAVFKLGQATPNWPTFTATLARLARAS